MEITTTPHVLVRLAREGFENDFPQKATDPSTQRDIPKDHESCPGQHSKSIIYQCKEKT